MTKLTSFLGINNVDAAEQIQDNELRAAKNIDIDRRGKLSRRKGFSQIYSGTNLHSLWSDGNITLFVEEGVLKSLDNSNNATTIRSGMTRFGRVSYYSVEGKIYYTDGNVTGIYSVDGSTPLGLPTPSTRPVLTPSTGVLPAGQYGVAFTVADASGAESGATISSWIQLSEDDAGINISGLHTAYAGATYVNIYMTTADGAEFFLARTVSAGVSSTSVSHPPQGAALRTQFLDAMPAGNHIAYFKGRILVARDNVLYYSEPYSPLTRLIQNFLMFPGKINMIAPVEDGVYFSVENDSIYHMYAGHPNDWSISQKASYPAIEGTAVLVDAELLPEELREEGWLWLSKNGICIGGAGGSFRNLTATRYAVADSDIGTAMLMQRDGTNQYVSTIHPNDGEVNNLHFSDVAVAEVRRNGVTIT